MKLLGDPAQADALLLLKEGDRDQGRIGHAGQADQRPEAGADLVHPGTEREEVVDEAAKGGISAVRHQRCF